ncbi:MAG: protein kinase domain-containing protein [Candidatus Dormibacteria bacterium]
MASTPEPGAGNSFSGYSVGPVVGTGLAGEIHRAWHVGGDWEGEREVAIEVIAPPLAHDEGFRERLSREAGAASMFDHPSVVRVFESLASSDRVGVVTAPYAGTALASVVGEEGVSPAAACFIGEAVLLGLANAHREGVVHGDVRAEAVIVDGARVRLAGFAVGRALHPELPPDGITDTYAVTMLMLALLGGAKLSRQVRAVIDRGSSHKVEHRYRTASGMRTALVAAARHDIGPDWRELATADITALAGAPSAAPPPAAPPEFGPPQPPPHAPPPELGPPAPLIPLIRAAPSETRFRRPPRFLKPALTGGGLVAAAVAVGLVAGLVVSAVRGPQPAPPSGLIVGKQLSIRIQPARGACNSLFIASAAGPVRGQGTLTYRWERSDGVESAESSLAVAAKDDTFIITEHWQLTGQVAQPSITFHLLTPVEMTVTQPLPYSCP